nr:hypothetical protein CFP56_11393 [Quercus suber]
MERQDQPGTCAHQPIHDGQLPQVLSEQRPLLEMQQTARVFQVPERGCDDQDSQPDPEQDEEAAKIAVVALGVEVRDAWSVLDSRKESSRGATVFTTGSGGGLDRRRRIVRRDGSVALARRVRKVLVVDGARERRMGEWTASTRLMNLGGTVAVDASTIRCRFDREHLEAGVQRRQVAAPIVQADEQRL